MDTSGKVRLAVANLRAGVEMLQTGADWKRALDVQARFHNYSFGNCALIQWQCPQATRVAGFNAWKKLGRNVKKGEKGIAILAPAGVGRREVEKADGTTDEHTWLRFRVAYVFDISQTEGKELASLARPIKLDETQFASSVEDLRKVALALPGGVVSAIEVRPRRAGESPNAGGWYDLRTRAIVVVTDGATRAQQFKTLVHELAHAILHPAGEHHTAPVREVEAESVAYVACGVLGLDSSSYSFPYVSHWACGDSAAKLVQKSGERIAKTARAILEALEAHRPTGDDDDSSDARVDAVEPASVLAAAMVAPVARGAVAAYADEAPAELVQDDAASIAAAKAAKRASNAKRALEAASDLAESARSDGAARVLDTRVLFGDLLASSASKWIAFTLGDVSITLPRTKLAEVARVLRRRTDLVASVDASGFHVRWNSGRGGLNFVSQPVPRDEQDRVLHVVFPVRTATSVAPVEVVEEPAAAPARRADEQVACGESASCDLSAPSECVRATTRWHWLMNYREVAELLAPALDRAATKSDKSAVLTLDARTFERARALLGGAASRHQTPCIAPAPASAAACV